MPAAFATEVPADSVGAALARGRRRLVRAGIDSAALDARLLLGSVLELPQGALPALADRPLGVAQARAFDALVAARAGRRPVSRLLGRRGFWDLELEIDDAVLDPRPDSECLVEAVLAQLSEPGRPLRLLDLGVGSGCLMLALLRALPRASAIGADISPGAVRCARRNAERLGLGARAAFVVGDWARALVGRFDVVVCNPPYIARGEIEGLAPEVREHDPRLALDGGDDGLACYRPISGDLGRLLADGGFAVLECDAGRIASVERLLRAAGLGRLARRYDLAGRPRCLIAAPSD